MTWAQRLIREKIEITPGTAVATTAADVLLARNATFRNLDADAQQRDFLTGIEGAQGEDLYNKTAGAEYEIEAAPPAVLGAAPLYAHLLRSSGWDMVMDDTDAVFTPMSPEAEIPACTQMLKNGAIQQVIAGVRGSVMFTAEVNRKPFFKFNRRGRFVAPVAHVQEAHDFSGWPRAIDCTPENMFAFTLGGTKLCVRSFNWTDNRSVTVDKYMNCAGAALGPRRFTGQMVVKWPAIAAKDLIALCEAGTTEPLIWTLGTVAGKTISMSCPKVQIKWAGEQNIDNDLGATLDLIFLPDAGDDEIEIRFQ